MMKLFRSGAIALALSLSLVSAALGQGSQGSSPLTIVKGGTGASTASGARTNLGLAIGTNVQAWDADLDALAALSGTNTIYYRNGAASWAAVSIGSFLSFSAGTLNVGDAELTALAGLTSANNKCFYWTGAGTAATFDCTSFGRSVANAADAAALRTLAGSVIGTDVQAYDADLAALASNVTAGLWASTGAGTGAARTLTPPAAGLTINNPAGTAGNPTFALANDLAAVEGLSSNGCAARTATDTWAVRTITGTTNQITVTNGDCVSGNPTISIPSNAVLPGAPTTTTASPSDNSTKIATTAYVDAQVAGGVSGVGSLNGQTGALVQWPSPQGRLTLTSNTPVMTTSVTAATTVYYTSTAAGKNVPVYNGSSVITRQLCAANTADACELSVALGANWTTNSNYDWFVGLDSGTLRLCSGPDWTAGAVSGSATARGTGAGSTELQNFDGLLTNKNSMTCRYANASTFTCAANQCTYLGTGRTGSAGQISFTYGSSASGGGTANLMLWNAYNQFPITSLTKDTTTSWTYGTATWRAPNANTTTYRVNYVSGLSSGLFTGKYAAFMFPNAAITAYAAVGYDSTSAICGTPSAANNQAFGSQVAICAQYSLGLHYMSALEYSSGASSTFYGVGNSGVYESGLWFDGLF